MVLCADKVFHYHADANPLGGILTEPASYIIETQASTSVSEAGGHAVSSVGKYEVPGVMSVQSATSEISGAPTSSGPKGWVTQVRSVVQKLNILGIVTVDEIVCNFTVKHPYDDPPYFPSVNFGQCSFTNLRVDGNPVTPVMDLQQFSRTADDVLAGGGCWLDDPVMIGNFCTQNAALLRNAPSWIRSRYSWVPNPDERHKKGHAVCSLVHGFNGVQGGVRAYGHVLEVDKLGCLFFGELTVHRGSFGVTMLRAEISSTATAPARGGTGVGGTMGVAVAHTNASPSP